jgi:DNA ligase 1
MEDKSLVENGNLERLASFISDMNSTNSSSAKSQKLQAYAGDEYIAKALLYTYDPYRRYYVTPANAEKNENLIEEHDDSLFEMLDSLNERKYTGHAAIGRVNAFLAKHFMYSKAVLAVLDRNLKIRMDVNEINKVFPDLIPTFDVALAKTYKKDMSEPDKKGKKKVDFENDVWYASRKLDGLRCVCMIDEDGAVSFMSRTGIPFNTLGVLANEISKWNLRSVVFDGEVCIMMPDGTEDFTAIVSQARKLNHTISMPKYNVFDMLTMDEFVKGVGVTNLGVRIATLNATMKAVNANKSIVSAIVQGRVKSVEHLKSLSEFAMEHGWEGIMLRKDVPYEGKRTSDMLKVKEMQDAEYVVEGIESDMITSTFYRERGTQNDVRYVDDVWRRASDGYEVPLDFVESYSDTRLMVSKIVIRHKGNTVGVGSGLSIDQRIEWHADPSKVVGKTVTIQYFQETVTDGVASLRFPGLKWKYDGGRDV